MIPPSIPSTSPAPAAARPGADAWLTRARAASVTLLQLVGRNPHGAFVTGRPVLSKDVASTAARSGSHTND